MQLTNVRIDSVKVGKSGEGQYGPWTLYKLKIGGKDYSLFGSADKPAPEAGQVFALIEYDEEKKGNYTNRTIKKMVQADEQPQTKGPREQAQPQATKDSPIWFCLSYCKDIAVALINKSEVKDISLDDIPIAVAKAAKAMLAEVMRQEEKPKSEEKPFDFKAVLVEIAKLKDRFKEIDPDFGEKQYYSMLKQYGVEHANKLNPDEMREFWGKLNRYIKEINEKY